MNGVTSGNTARRYPMSFALRYVMAAPEAARKGAGETVWMSGKEVSFIAKGPGGVGDKVDLHIDWPVLLEGSVPLQLSAVAEIVQRSGPLFVAKMTKYEFRTRAVQSTPLPIVVRQPGAINTYRPAVAAWPEPRRAVAAISAAS